MTSARAFVIFEQSSPLKEVQVQLDDLRPNELLVEIKATSICATDINVQTGKIPVPLPAVVGHEGGGVVLKVGSAVRGISIGDHVLLTYNHCGACGPCQQEKPYQCSDIRQRNFGCKRPDGSDYIHYENQPVSGCFFGQSSFCNPAIVQEASCVKIDPSLPLSRLCTLGCGFQTGAGAVFNLVKPVDHQVQSLAIWGCGGVGLAAIMAANAIKNGHPGVLDRIIAIDINEERLELAKSFGATDAINSRQPDVERRLGEVTEGRGPDAAIDCTGLVPVVNQMIQSLGAGGMAVTVGGPPPGQQASIDVFPFLLNCKTYVGCHQGNSYSRKFIPLLAELYADGKLPLNKMQTQYHVSEINQAIEDMAKGRVIKPVLLWD